MRLRQTLATVAVAAGTAAITSGAVTAIAQNDPGQPNGESSAGAMRGEHQDMPSAAQGMHGAMMRDAEMRRLHREMMRGPEMRAMHRHMMSMARMHER
jgi:hypothetical protein